MDTIGRNPLVWVTGLVASAFICFLAAGAVLPPPTAFPDPAGATVRMEMPGGHGSGVHLGGGFFLTAGHVAEGSKTLHVVLDNGEAYDGEVLWSNHAYDVALVYVEGYSGSSAHLSCAPVHVGQDIRIEGNPLGTEFAVSWGRVSALGKTGLEGLDKDGLWKRLVTLDATAAPGVSGGGVYDVGTGDLVGILVAGAISPRGTFAYSYMVPGEAICHVLGRA